ncbi:hypothetical protein ACFL6S_13995 [Candidatus Poribacteria bacterium]
MTLVFVLMFCYIGLGGGYETFFTTLSQAIMDSHSETIDNGY